MDFGQPNVEIGQKMANGQLLFLALQQRYIIVVVYLQNCFIKEGFSTVSWSFL